MVDPQVEVLEAPGISRRTSRALAVALVLLVVTGSVGYVADGRARRGEQRALSACVAHAGSVLDGAYRPVVAMWTYVRPALDNGASLMVRASIYRVMSGTVSGRAAGVAAARDRCAAVRVLPFHQGLVARRHRCVQLLDEHVEFLTRAAVDGRVLGEDWPGPVARC